MPTRVQHHVDLTRPGHEIRVVLRWDEAPAGPQSLVMARWTPGSYLIREFARHVNAIRAWRDGREVSVRRAGVDEWIVGEAGLDGEDGEEGAALDGPLEVETLVHARELTVRTSYLAADRALLSGAATFLRPLAAADASHAVTVETPAAWPEPECALPREGDAFVAESFDELIDSPIAAGPCESADIEVAGVPHRIVAYGRGDASLDDLVEDVRATCEASAAIFGGELPFRRYLFILQWGCSGGLEHAASSVCGFPAPGFTKAANRRRRLSLVAHEYFHVWNVKRIRPEALGPFDYRREVHTPHLWVAEGLTSYYQHLIGLRAGIMGPGRLLTILVSYLVDYERTPGRHLQSVEDSSFDAWIKLYRGDENSRNSQVSYYAVGCLVGWVLDLAIRSRTRGERGLDDALRTLWSRYLERPERGFTDAELRAAIDGAAGEAMGELLDALVREPGRIDVDAALAGVGLEVERVSRAESSGWLGIAPRVEGGRVMVERVVRDGPAWRAGLSPGEEILAIDGFRVGQDLAPWLAGKARGDEVVVTSALWGRLREVTLSLDEPLTTDYRVRRAASVGEAEKAALRGWLDVDWDGLELLDEPPEDQRSASVARAV